MGLLPDDTEPSPLGFFASTSRIQHIHLPPHHLDQPDTLPTFKGFALVTFSNEADAKHILASWPWEGSSSLYNEDKGAKKDAARFGFRSTTKSTWEALRAEYLVYRAQLIESLNAHQDTSTPSANAIAVGERVADRSPSQPLREQASKTATGTEEEFSSKVSPPTITWDSPYPYGCLIFVRNVHPETNKTTLKTLFGRAISDVQKSGGIDYIDFNKGMDTVRLSLIPLCFQPRLTFCIEQCYLRLSSPACAEHLFSFYASNSVIQTNGLDDTGSTHPSSSSPHQKPISMEIVCGMREELYWNKVPEKIRYSAVEKALQMMEGALAVENSKVGGGKVEGYEEGDDARPKKRRKR